MGSKAGTVTWSYSGDPASSDKDAVRFYVQDVREDFPLLEDEEIEYVLSTWKPAYDSVIYCAAVCAEVIASKFAREVSVSADGVSVGANELQDKYKKLAEDLRDQWKEIQGAGAGAEIPSDVWGMWDDTIAQTVFALGMHDNPEAGRQEYGGTLRRAANPEW